MDVSFGGDSSFLGAPPAPVSSISVFNSRPTRSPMVKPTGSGSGSKKRKRSEPDPESEDPAFRAEEGSASNDANDASLPAASNSPAAPKRKMHRTTVKEPPPPPSVRSTTPASSKAIKAKSASGSSKPKLPRVVKESRVPTPPPKERTPVASSSAAPIDDDPEYDPSETFLGNVIPTDPRELPGGFIIPDANDSVFEFNLVPVDLDYDFFPPPASRSNHGLLQYFAAFALQTAHRFVETSVFRTPAWRDSDSGRYLLRMLGDRETTTVCFSRVRPILTSIDRFIKLYPVVEPYAFHHTSVNDPIYDDPSELPLSPPSKNFVPQPGPSVAGITSPEELAKFQALAMEDFQKQFSAWSAASLKENQEYQAALGRRAASRQARFEASGRVQTMYADQVEEYNAGRHAVLLRNVGVVRSLGELGLIAHIGVERFFEAYVPPPPPFPNAVECFPNPDCSPTSISDLLDPAYRPPPPPPAPSIPVVSRAASVAPSDKSAPPIVDPCMTNPLLVSSSVVSRRFASVAGLQGETANSQLGDEFDFGDGDDGEEDELEESPAPLPAKGKGKGKARAADKIEVDEGVGGDGGRGLKPARKGAKKTRLRDLPGHDPQAAVPRPECFDKKRSVDINPLMYQPYHHGEPMFEGGKRDREGNLVNTGGFRTSNEEGCEGMFEGFEDDHVSVSAAGPLVYFTRGPGCKKCKKRDCACMRPHKGYTMTEKCLGCSSGRDTCNGEEGFDFTRTDATIERPNLYYFTELLQRSGWLYSRILGHNTSDMMITTALAVRKCGTFAPGTAKSRAIHIPNAFDPPAAADVAFVAARADLKLQVSDRFTGLIQIAEERLLQSVGNLSPENSACDVIKGLVDVVEGFAGQLRDHLELLDRCDFPNTDNLVRRALEGGNVGTSGAAPPDASVKAWGSGSGMVLGDEDAEGEMVDDGAVVGAGLQDPLTAAATPGGQVFGQGVPPTPIASSGANFRNSGFGSHGSAPSTPSLLQYSFSPTRPPPAGSSFGAGSPFLDPPVVPATSSVLSFPPLPPPGSRTSPSPRKPATPEPNGQKLA
ncbi:hypothetical protein DFH09DRAFT_1085518 [Mycena vulgaris]|nr:hypothetical protein DFH09DRAFT_1085518 [Mycena vulgaris]